MALKHVGRMVNNRRKVAVTYRTIPGDATHCIVVPTENLMADEHDSLIRLIESNAGQTANELADAMTRAVLPDGRNMLAAFHQTGRLVKVPTSNVEMVPDNQTSIRLDELNKVIAEQKGVSIDDLAITSDRPIPKETIDVNAKEDTVLPVVEDVVAPDTQTDVLTDDQLAAQYRSQADTMFKEAKRLREQAEELSPTKKKAKTKSEESA